MAYTDCGACGTKMAARPPNKAFWSLIAAFWVTSIALGIGAAQGHGWDLVVVASWAALASSVVLLARRATTWTCAECGSTVAPPLEALTTASASASASRSGAFRAMHARHE